MAGVGNAIAEADSTPDIRAVVLTGTGDRAFCAGMDLRAFAGGGLAPTEDEQKGMAVFGRFMSRGESETPVIGAAQATALAGGFELLLACDLIVAAEGAKVGLPEVKRGLFAAGGGKFLSRGGPPGQGPGGPMNRGPPPVDAGRPPGPMQKNGAGRKG